MKTVSVYDFKKIVSKTKPDMIGYAIWMNKRSKINSKKSKRKGVIFFKYFIN